MSSVQVRNFRNSVADASDGEIDDLVDEIRDALEGDSNDAEHDALVSVAQFFAVDYVYPDDVEDDDDSA